MSITPVAQLLIESRAAHNLAKGQQRAGHAENARELFTAALEKRLAARDADPDRRDPAWLDDALAPPRPGIQGKQYHRMPGKTLAEVAQVHDVELELFYRQQTGEQPNPVIEPSSQLETRVLVPEMWQTQQAGVTLCLCGHPDDDHDDRQRCAHFDKCGCEIYEPSLCAHAFEPSGDKLRQCVTCGERQALVPKMAIEDTMAFQQGRKEAHEGPGR